MAGEFVGNEENWDTSSLSSNCESPYTSDHLTTESSDEESECDLNYTENLDDFLDKVTNFFM